MAWRGASSDRQDGFASVRFQSASFSKDIAYLWQIVLFLWWRERDGRVEAGDADDGPVEIVEGFFIDDGGDLAG